MSFLQAPSFDLTHLPATSSTYARAMELAQTIESIQLMPKLATLRKIPMRLH